MLAGLYLLLQVLKSITHGNNKNRCMLYVRVAISQAQHRMAFSKCVLEAVG